MSVFALISLPPFPAEGEHVRLVGDSLGFWCSLARAVVGVV
jgi:hypothetical protein